jgi:NitT/TauT family transport system ATP-binding protein
VTSSAGGGSANKGPPPVTAWQIAKTYETGTEVIRSISFSVGQGEIVSIVGPSGCGKTTLLNMLCGLLPLSQGAVMWYGREIDGVPPGAGYMLQKDLLFPWRTAYENVALGLQLKAVGRKQRRERVTALLEQLGLTGFADYYPSALSGGMRQRVALARTFAGDPQVLLLDEPFSALDFQTKLLIERDTAKLVREQGRSLLLITHDVEEAVSLSDRVIVLSHRPCTIVAEHIIEFGGDRSDMMAAREHPEFYHHVRGIWNELDIR